MKKKFLLLLVLFVLLFSSIAYAWRANVNVLVHPLQVKATVWNSLPVPIACRGKVIGVLSSGIQGYAWFDGVISPNTSSYAFVSTNNVNDPFVNGWANIQCRTLNY